MSVLTADEPDHVTTTTHPVAHIRRAEDGPNLCGARNGMGFTVAEGEDPGDPWPYLNWCATCRDKSFGDYDDPAGVSV